MRVTDPSQIQVGQYYLCQGRALVIVLARIDNMEWKAKSWQPRGTLHLGTNGEVYSLTAPQTWVEDNHPLLVSTDQAKVLISLWGTGD